MISEFFKTNKKVALGFSGGVDSGYLFYEALRSGADVCAYYVKTEFQPKFELLDAIRLAKDIGGKMKVLDFSILTVPEAAQNGRLRCYYCKTAIFSLIKSEAEKDGYPLLIDGNNASDDETDRPGMKAANELGVISPLRLCGFSKADVREKARDAGLFIWNKPSYSCLATRIEMGIPIELKALQRIERGEEILFELGFTEFRLRQKDGFALLSLPEAQHKKARLMWEAITKRLSGDFGEIRLGVRG